jgi:hypothetical protein
MKKNIFLLLLSCYFLPFCLFFAQALWASNRMAFCACLLAVSAGTLTLFFAIKKLETKNVGSQQIIEVPKKEVRLHHLLPSSARKQQEQMPIRFQATHPESQKVMLLQERIKTQEQELLFSKQKEEMLTAAIDELKTEVEKKNSEIENLQFELRVLVRLDEKILSAGAFDDKVPDTAQKTQAQVVLESLNPETSRPPLRS